MSEEARERQLAEAESIEAIFAEEFHAIGTWREEPSEEITFTVSIDITLVLRISMPSGYPESARPQVDVSWSGVGDISPCRALLLDYLLSLPLGEEMVYTLVTWCQEQLADGILEKDAAAPVADCADVPSSSFRERTSSTAVEAQRILTDKSSHRCLPLSKYFRAEALGEGACGSVMHVYDEDGQEWAAKQFERAEDGAIDLSTLREIGILRAFRATSAMHPNIIAITDMAIINGELCMIMASYKCSLRDALIGGALPAKKGSQVQIARGLLGAVSFLHGCKAMHRDIKPGNVMLTDSLEPVLIDFSLAKIDLGVLTAQTSEERAPRTAKERRRKARGKHMAKSNGEEMRHSQGVGTPLYMAPEVCTSEAYDVSADMWSLGVVLFEVFDADFCKKLDECEKEKAAHTLVAESVMRLGAKPIPTLLRSLLNVDASARLSAKVALEHLRDAVPKGMLGEQVAEPTPAQLHSDSPSGSEVLPDGLDAELSLWTAFFRCSGRVRYYARIYVDKSELARKKVLHTVVLAARLHETDPEAAPVYDLEELQDWACEEEDDDMIEGLSGLADYLEVEQGILRELDYVLY